MISLYSLLSEAIKSYPIDVVIKKISSFFIANGLIEKDLYDFDFPKEKPYFTITSDRFYLKKNVEQYKDKNHFLTKGMLKHGYKQEDLIKNAEDNYNDFQYGDIFIYTNKNSPELTKRLLRIIDSCGYFIATVGVRNISKSEIESFLINNDRLSISIEPYFDKEEEGDEYVYHTTKKDNLEKIMRVGLIPKSKNTRSFYPERIYLTPNEKWLESIKQQLSGDKNGEYVDLKIKKFDGLKLYRDVRFKGGYYTYNNIPPKYIEVI